MLGRVDLFNTKVVLGLRMLDTFTKQLGFGSTHIADYLTAKNYLNFFYFNPSECIFLTCILLSKCKKPVLGLIILT